MNINRYVIAIFGCIFMACGGDDSIPGIPDAIEIEGDSGRDTSVGGNVDIPDTSGAGLILYPLVPERLVSSNEPRRGEGEVDADTGYMPDTQVAGEDIANIADTSVDVTDANTEVCDVFQLPEFIQLTDEVANENDIPCDIDTEIGIDEFTMSEEIKISDSHSIQINEIKEKDCSDDNDNGCYTDDLTITCVFGENEYGLLIYKDATAYYFCVEERDV